MKIVSIITEHTAGEDLLPLHAWSISAKLRALRCTPISVCADRVLACRVTFRGGLTITTGIHGESWIKSPSVRKRPLRSGIRQE